ncbi:MAG: hypothetical protein AAGD25_04885 [Cyanobacteria bacterium P01_F01_bin.150]
MLWAMEQGWRCIPGMADCLPHPQIAQLPLQRYRIIGDPMVPLYGAIDALT